MKWMPSTLRGEDFAGLYAIYLDGRLAYIGISFNIRKRFAGHSLRQADAEKSFRGAQFRTMTIKVRQEACDLKRTLVESALIARIRPFLNGRDNPNHKRWKYKMSNGINLQFRRFVNEWGGQAKVAGALGISPGHACLLYNGKRRVTVNLAQKIELVSAGKYSRESLVFPGRRASKTEAA